jgi:hypothetical protein
VKDPSIVDPERMSLEAIKSIPIEWFAGYLRAVGAHKASLDPVSARQPPATASTSLALDQVEVRVKKLILQPIIPTSDQAKTQFWETVSMIFNVGRR